jgi:hypothetical protein
MRYIFINPHAGKTYSNEELQTRVRKFFTPPKALHDLVLVQVSLDEDICQLKRNFEQAQQAAVDSWQAQAREEDLCLRIERHWIPYQCIFLPGTAVSQKFQRIAEAIAQIPMQAAVLPRNRNQAYWLKMQHYNYQALGLLVANQLFPLLRGDYHPRNLLQNRIGSKETHKLEKLAAVDTALYELVQAVAPQLKESQCSSDIDTESYTLSLFVDIQEQSFVRGWNNGPANPGNTWISLKEKDDWHVKKTRFLKKLSEGSSLVDRERRYLEEIAQTGPYWMVLKAALSSDRPRSALDRYERYIDALVAAKPACISEMNWIQGQPYKLESASNLNWQRPAPLLCSAIPEESCECPFRMIGTDLNHSHCIKRQQHEREALRRPKTPRPINGAVDIYGFIIWSWELSNPDKFARKS